MSSMKWYFNLLIFKKLPASNCNNKNFRIALVYKIISQGTYRIASWRGIQVAVKRLGDEVIIDEDKVWVFNTSNEKAFRDELALLQKIRHPNVVQFLGAVTQSSPMMIVTEYLPKGDLHAFLKRKGALKTATAVKFALDIARGMNYLHEHRPEAIIHRDLEPSNILRDDSGHLKVADFGVSKLLKVANTVKEDYPLICQETSCRYMAPEVFKNEAYGTKVDVFSFALILQEMIEGCPPFSAKPENEVPKVYAAQERPPFRAPSKLYSHGLKELIEECWNENPTKRPTFGQILTRLDRIYNHLGHKRRWKIAMGRRTWVSLRDSWHILIFDKQRLLGPPTTSTLMLLSLMDVKIVPGVCAVNKRLGKLMKLEVLIKPVGNEDIKEVMEVHASYASLTIEENRGGDRDSPTKRDSTMLWHEKMRSPGGGPTWLETTGEMALAS
ncbi:Integrin-linked protein kinase 1 [Vitis vinifera]|uniref:non-specific serine/threonine protein kinase n=1 Tax=Vitis vinifera TaxID=29760 RepID=A0A438CDQ7_VITVI|nr:Integrin-linked protein kinase 1 [Vitis vinifera]